MRHLALMTLAFALVAGCKREKKDVAGPAPLAAGRARTSPGQGGPAGEGAQDAPLPKHQPGAAQPGTPAVGMTRTEFMRIASDCVIRTVLVPPGPNRLVTEVYQPREGPCMERLGQKRFFMVGGRLQDIRAGVDKPPS